jgi:hypothetical protein
MKRALILINAVPLLLLHFISCYSQENIQSPPGDRVQQIPTGFLQSIQNKADKLNQDLVSQTDKFLQKESRRENRILQKLRRKDSLAAKQYSDRISGQYVSLTDQFRQGKGFTDIPVSGEYQANADSLRNMLGFLKTQPGLISDPHAAALLNGSTKELHLLQGRLQYTETIRQEVRERREQLGQILREHTNLSGLLGKDYQGMSQDLYYYSQQVHQVKDVLNNPEALEKRALAALNQLPAFQSFLREHSQLSGLFNLAGNYGSDQGVVGLQTRDQVNQLIQSQVAAGGAGGAAALQSNFQSASSQLDSYKEKLNRLGPGGQDIDMPNFRPNDQKTQTFWKRLEYGANFQTTRNSGYFPTMTDLGLSLGYRLGHSHIIGIGASYKLGWGTGWNHIAFSSQGAGFRSFLDIHLKKTFFLSGGLEYNYMTPISSLRQISHIQYWTPSGLVGLSKTISVKNRVFKKTKLSLLWDFLSYQQVPKTQPVVFRIGYSF